MLNGRAIFLAVAAYLPTVDAESNALMHTKCIEWMRDNPLPDNATADQFTKRFTELAIKHRPFADGVVDGVGVYAIRIYGCMP